ncbi:MAG: two-component regulator propeller domain-containing protein, partial [Acidobacteriota bacterium]
GVPTTVPVHGEAGALDDTTRQTWLFDDGLPQETVRALAQASDGSLWIGTRSGLARFDGVRFSTTSRADAPSLSGSIRTLLVDRRGTLWIGTEAAGLVRHREGRFDSLGVEDGLPDLRVTALHQDSTGAVWIATLGGILIHRDGDSARLVDRAAGLPSDRIACLAEDGGRLYIGTDDAGLAVWVDGGVQRILDVDDGLPSADIRSLAVAAPGRIWVATNRGLALVTHGGRVERVLESTEGPYGERIVAIARSRHGGLWIGTDGRGLHRMHVDGTIEASAERSASAFHIRSLLEDRRGDLWLGTRSNGLHRLSRGPFVTYDTDDGLRSKIVTAVIAAREGGAWFATRDRGVHRRGPDGSMRVFGRDEGFEVLGAWSMVEDESGLWVGTDGGGLYRLTDGRASRVLRSESLNRRVFAVESDGTGGLWLGTNDGIAHLAAPITPDAEGPVRRFGVADGLPGGQIRALHRDPSGQLWIGTVDGLAVLSNLEITERRGPAGESIENVHSLHRDRRGALWVGSEGMGLVRLDGSRTDRLDVRTGLFSDQIVTVLEDGEANLWLGSSQGVGRIAAADLERFADDPEAPLPQLVFGRADGLGGGGVWGSDQGGTLGVDGRLYFGTREGLAVIDPIAVVVDPAPQAQIEWIEVIERGALPARHPPSPTMDTPLPMPANVHEVRFHFSAPAIGRGGPRNLRFRLDGFDRDWTHAPKRQDKAYTYLPPGDYVFEVQASDGAGRWLGPVARQRVHVRPGFFESPIFYGLLALTSMLTAAGLHRLRVRQLERHRDTLTSRVEAAMDDLRVLRGLVPICGSCRKIRNDRGYWQQIDLFLHDHSEATFTHGLCPPCAEATLRELDDDSSIISRPF